MILSPFSEAGSPTIRLPVVQAKHTFFAEVVKMPNVKPVFILKLNLVF
jgi:hypothetical protein